MKVDEFYFTCAPQCNQLDKGLANILFEYLDNQYCNNTVLTKTDCGLDLV